MIDRKLFEIINELKNIDGWIHKPTLVKRIINDYKVTKKTAYNRIDKIDNITKKGGYIKFKNIDIIYNNQPNNTFNEIFIIIDNIKDKDGFFKKVDLSKSIMVYLNISKKTSYNYIDRLNTIKNGMYLKLNNKKISDLYKKEFKQGYKCPVCNIKYNKELFNKNDNLCRECRQKDSRDRYAKNPNSRLKIQSQRKRNMGFIPLNYHLPNHDGHHIDNEYVIYIPHDIHTSIYHNHNKPNTMVEINKIAFKYLNTCDHTEEFKAWQFIVISLNQSQYT